MEIKEKLIELKTKAKEKLEVAKEKAKDYISEHEFGLCVGGASVFSLALLAMAFHKEQEAREEAINMSNEASAKLKEMITEVKYDEKKENEWDETYKETYDKVIDFADSLDLKPGEMYVIEDVNQYRGEGLPPDIVVSHLVYGTGIYPPKE